MTSQDESNKSASAAGLSAERGAPNASGVEPMPGTTHLSPAQLREARRFAVQFVYQLDLNQQLYFQELTFDMFCSQAQMPGEEQRFVRALAQGVLQRLTHIDTLITNHSKNWKLSRIARVDLAVLRVCALELMGRPDVPVDIIIADAAEIGKQYGSSGSSAFINGVLDGIARDVRAPA